MENFEFKQTPKRVVSQAVGGLCFLVAFAIAIGVILSSSSKNCENPIREWLIVWICVNSGSFLILTISNCIAINDPDSIFARISKFVTVSAGLFGIGWIIVGSVWLYTDNICENYFHDMWALTLAILIITYATCCCCCFAICCVGVMFCVKTKMRIGDS